MKDWAWFDESFVLAVHDEQIREHGGLDGLRDRGLLASALAKPQQLAAYGAPDAADLASAYAFGVARNHPFLDGNKRTAFVLAETFLNLNGYVLPATDEDCYLTMIRLAAGELTQEEFAAWVRNNMARIEDQKNL